MVARRTKLAFARGGNTSDRIWVMNADGSNPHGVGPVVGQMNVECPIWSPDGTTILFTDTFGDDTGGGLWTMSASGAGATEMLSRPPKTGTPLDGPELDRRRRFAPTSALRRASGA